MVGAAAADFVVEAKVIMAVEGSNQMEDPTTIAHIVHVKLRQQKGSWMDQWSR